MVNPDTRAAGCPEHSAAVSHSVVSASGEAGTSAKSVGRRGRSFSASTCPVSDATCLAIADLMAKLPAITHPFRNARQVFGPIFGQETRLRRRCLVAVSGLRRHGDRVNRGI